MQINVMLSVTFNFCLVLKQQHNGKRGWSIYFPSDNHFIFVRIPIAINPHTNYRLVKNKKITSMSFQSKSVYLWFLSSENID